MSKLQTNFIDTFKNQQVITTKEVYEWYKLNKTNPSQLPQRITIHQLIINPLLHKGLLTKVGKGCYALCNTFEKDEWDKYVEAKLQNERR